LLHSNGRIFFTNKNHLVKENPYLQNSSSVSSPQSNTTQHIRLSLISLKRFSISRRGKKETKNSTERHTQAKARKLENFSSWHSKFTNANTLPEENNKKTRHKQKTKNQRQERRRRRRRRT
jgi:hypothetical protein